MKRLVAGVTLLAVAGCAPLQTETRTERGPLLRTYQKEVSLGQRTVAGSVQAQWPRVVVHLETADACRTELHEEYAEEVITEHHDPSAAPALSAGASAAAVGAGLLLARPLFSDAPDTDAIDRSGHYGASSRKRATVWGVVLLGIGVPSLVTGIVQVARSGEERQTRKVDTVASLHDSACNARPAHGVVEVVGRGAQVPARSVTDGTLTLSAEELRGVSAAGLVLDDTPVALSDEDAALLNAFSACAQLQGLPMDAQTLGQQSLEQLMGMRAVAAQCASVPGAPGRQWMDAIDSAVSAANGGAQPGQGPEAAGPQYESFEDAVAKLKPSLRVGAGSADVAKLRQPQALKGQAVQLTGVLTQQVNPDTVVVQVGDVPVLVLMDPRRPWASDFARGSRVELVGTVEGVHPLGTTAAPLVRAVWMRQAL